MDSSLHCLLNVVRALKRGCPWVLLLPLLYQPLSLVFRSNRSDKDYMFACRLTVSPVSPQMITAEPAKAASPRSAQSNRGKWSSQTREGRANWKPNIPQPSGTVFLVHGTCWVLCIYREISDSTNDMESPPMALEPPPAARRVVLNARGTAWRVPQEQTCRRCAAVLRIVIFKYSHI